MKLKYARNYPRQYAEFRSIIHSVFIYRFVQIKFIIINSRIDELYNVHVLSANRTDSTEFGIFFLSFSSFSLLFIIRSHNSCFNIYRRRLQFIISKCKFWEHFVGLVIVSILNIAFIYVWQHASFLLCISPIFICCVGIVTWFLFSVISLLFQHRPIEWRN